MKKKIDHNEILRWKLHNASSIISEAFPSVSSITIKQTFWDDSGNNQIGNKKIWDMNVKTARLFFIIKCPQNCIDGGYDITSEIISMLDKVESFRVGKLVCQGWQDEERINKFHCLTTLEYEINIEYNSKQ